MRYRTFNLRVAFAVLAGAVVVAPLDAQGPGRAGFSRVSSAPAPLPPRLTHDVADDSMSSRRIDLIMIADSTRIPRTHWKTGAIIGASVGFPVGFVALSSMGEGSTGDHIRDGFLGGLGVAAILAMIGGLIGSLFHAS